IYDVKAGHFTHSYNASFMGFAPVTNPAIVVVVTLNGTHGSSGFGGAVAAPVFRTVATEVLRVLDVPKDLPDEPPAPLLLARNDAENALAIADVGPDQRPLLDDSDDPPAGPKVPDFKGMNMRTVFAEAAAKGVTVRADGSGVARSQTPPPGSILRPGER